LLRIVLPVSSSLPPTGRWNVDLALLLPMLRLLEQSLHHPGGQERRAELGATLFAYLMHVLEAAGCVITLSSSSSFISGPSDDEEDLITRLTHWLNPRLSEPLSLALLSQAVSVSPRRLQEIFRIEMKCTPMEYLRYLRLDALSRYLRDPAHSHGSVRTLMRMSGLRDSLATRRDFLKRFGCYPSDYRGSRQL